MNEHVGSTTNGLGSASLACGILAAVLALLSPTPAVILGSLGVIFGAEARARVPHVARSQSLAGMALGGLGIVGGLAMIGAFFVV